MNVKNISIVSARAFICLGLLVFLWTFNSNISLAENDFSQVDYYSAGSFAYDVSAGDLNNDGYYDLIVAQGIPENIVILMNNGDGTFIHNNIISLGYRTTAITIADFDGDGDNDFAAGSIYYGNISGDLIIFENDGDGNFEVVEILNIGVGIEEGIILELTSNDLDNDGDTDLVAAGSYGLQNGHVTVLSNDSSGHFSITSSTITDQSPRSVVTADIDNDGLTDIATVNLEDQTASILLNDETGIFAVTSTINTVGIAPTSLIASDLDNDEDIDFAVTDQNQHNLLILTNDGFGSFSLTQTLNTSDYVNGGNPNSVVAEDFDKDSDIDLAVVNHNPGDIAIFLNDGSGNYYLDQTVYIGIEAMQVISSDVDENTYPDLIVTYRGGIAAVLNLSSNQSPEELVNEIIDDVVDFEFPSNLENAYLANLSKVEQLINEEKTIPAINQINAFIKKVNQDLKQGTITQEEATSLIDAASELLNILSLS